MSETLQQSPGVNYQVPASVCCKSCSPRCNYAPVQLVKGKRSQEFAMVQLAAVVYRRASEKAAWPGGARESRFDRPLQGNSRNMSVRRLSAHALTFVDLVWRKGNLCIWQHVNIEWNFLHMIYVVCVTYVYTYAVCVGVCRGTHYSQFYTYMCQKVKIVKSRMITTSVKYKLPLVIEFYEHTIHLLLRKR